jgi:ABC-type branched-subunit amino acid transport system substrate-binding protein
MAEFGKIKTEGALMSRKLSGSKLGRREFLTAGAVAGASLASGLSFNIRTAQAQQDDFKIGWVRPTTGRLASSFAPLYIGGLIAIDEINAKGGILGRRIVRVEEDDEGSPAKGPAVVRKLNDANINVVCGPVGSSQNLSAVQSTTSLKMIHCGYGAATDLANAVQYPYFYQLVLNTDLQAQLACTYAVETLGAKKIGIIQESTAFGEQATAGSVAMLKRLGLSPAKVEAYPITATSLEPYIANLQRAGADVVVAWIGNVPNVAMAFNAMNALKWYPPVVGHNGLFSDALFDLVPLEMLKNVNLTYLKAFTWTATESPGARQVEYAKKIATYPEAKAWEVNVAAGPFYDFLHILKAVVESEKTVDPEKIKRALDSVTNYDGMNGKISFSPSDHCGIKLDQMCLAKLSSGRDPRALGILRERV